MGALAKPLSSESLKLNFFTYEMREPGETGGLQSVFCNVRYSTKSLKGLLEEERKTEQTGSWPPFDTAASSLSTVFLMG